MAKPYSHLDLLEMVKNSDEIIHQIFVKNLPKKGKVKLPEMLIVDGELEISFETFRDDWMNKSYHAILIGEGITHDQLEALGEDFFSHISIDLEQGNLYIVDLPSLGHESIAGRMANRWDKVFEMHFANWIQITDRTRCTSFRGMQADDSWRFVHRFRASGFSIPFIVVEIAWSQTFESVLSKTARWFEHGVLYVVVVKKFFTKNQYLVLLMQKDVEQPIFQQIFAFKELADFSVPVSKSFIFAHYPVQNYDILPEADIIELPVNLVFRY